MKAVYAEVGLDWQDAMAAIQEAFGDEHRREQMKESANIFRVLIKTLLNAGIITDRTRGFYGMYVDMDGLKAEGERMVGDDIAEDGIKFLQSVNFGDQCEDREDRGGVEPARYCARKARLRPGFLLCAVAQEFATGFQTQRQHERTSTRRTRGTPRA